MKILYEELKPQELKEIIKKSGIIYLPLGALEWHERHLPLGTDGIISYKICKKLCRKNGGCVIPPLYFGTDREHKIKGETLHGMDAKAKKHLTGSIYFLKKDLFYKLLKSIIKNIAQQGFKKLVIISEHTGTAQVNILEKLEKESFGKLKIMVFPGRDYFPKEYGAMDHAGKSETNLMLAVRPELVNISKIKKPYLGLIGDDPKKASKKEGRKIFNKIVNNLLGKIKK